MKRFLLLIPILVVACAPVSGASLPSARPPATPGPAGPTVSAAPFAPEPAAAGFPPRNGHGDHYVAVDIPAGRYRLAWQAEGVNPDGSPGSCDFSVQADGRTLVSSRVGTRGNEGGEIDVDLPATRVLAILGTGCVWSVSLN